MSGYLRRLATTGAAYTAASIFSKLIAVALLPLYTRYLTQADYGAAEVMFAAVVSASIVVRLGLIEALLRFYYKDGEDPAAVVSSTFAGALLVRDDRRADRAALRRRRSPKRCSTPTAATDLARISIGGLWVLTMFEFLLTLFRLEERARAFFVTTILNVLATIGLTVVLVVGAGDGARGLLVGSYASGAAFVLALIVVQRRRLSLRFDRELLRRLLRFGLPTMPAELSLYLLNFVDRIIIVRSAGLAEAGLYSLAVKFAQGSTSSSAASSSPGRRWPTRSATTGRRGASTPRSSPCSSPAALLPSPACGCSRAGSCGPSPHRSSSAPTRRSA